MNVTSQFTKAAVLSALAAFGFISQGVAAYPEKVEEGFVSIFNGKDLTGWGGATEGYGINPKEPGVLQCFPDRKLPKGKRGDLWTLRDYTNFVLRFEFVMPRNGNNGLGIRMPRKGDAAYEGMCEIQLLDDGGPSYYDAKHRKDKLKPHQYCGSIYGVYASRRDNHRQANRGKQRSFTAGGSFVRKPGMWNFAEVKVIGSEIEVYINGALVTKGDVAKFRGNGDTPDRRKHPGLHRKSGAISWLGHGANVKWRNIRIKELPADAKMGELCPNQTMKCPEGFETFFAGKEEHLANWKGVTTEQKFDNPIVRQAATPEKRRQMQAKADELMRRHWSVRNGNLFFDGFKGGYSLATNRDFEDFEMWADWRILSITGDSGLYLRGAPQVQIWDAHNQWHIGSGGLYNNQKNPSKPLALADKQVGDWNRFYVKMVGDRVTVKLNGVLVVDNVKLENYWDRKRPIFPIEQIELQCHGDPIEWRNIFIKPLPVTTVSRERVGVCSWSFQKPMKEVAAEMEKLGVKGIHLALGPFVNPDKRHGEAEGKEALDFVKNQIKSGKWKLMSTMIGTVGEDYSTLETIKKTGGIVPDQHWEANKKIVTAGAKLTQELGAKYMSLHAGFLDENDKEAYAEYVERIKWVRDEAKKYGVTILLESGQETAEDLAKFLEDVPGVYVNYDPANMILYSKGTPVEAVKKLFKFIKQVHIKDALYTRKKGTWGTEVVWGDGQVGGRNFLKALEVLGYKGDYVIEREGGFSRVKDIGIAAERLTK
jgi:sugar phosphate isomerase/epimerase